MLVTQLVHRHAIERFVRANVDGANGHRQAVHCDHGGSVGLELLIFARQFTFAVHEQELAAKQADPNRTRLECRSRIRRHLDVRQQLDALAIKRDGRRVSQAREAFAFEFALALTKPVFLQHDGRGFDDHDAGIAVDDHPVVLSDDAAGLTRADDSRDVHAACHDRRVRGLATHVGDEAGEHAALELQHVGRGDIVGDHHERVFATKIARTGAGCRRKR